MKKDKTYPGTHTPCVRHNLCRAWLLHQNALQFFHGVRATIVAFRLFWGLFLDDRTQMGTAEAGKPTFDYFLPCQPLLSLPPSSRKSDLRFTDPSRPPSD